MTGEENVKDEMASRFCQEYSKDAIIMEEINMISCIQI